MDYFSKAIAAAIGAAISFFTGIPPLMWVLLGAMSLDYVTGLICAWRGKSPKTEGGGLSSRVACEGLIKKVMVLLLVALAALVDFAIANGAGIAFHATGGVVCLWFIASEGLSVLENGAEIGVPIPEVLKRALEVMKGAGEEEKGNK